MGQKSRRCQVASAPPAIPFAWAAHFSLGNCRSGGLKPMWGREPLSCQGLDRSCGHPHIKPVRSSTIAISPPNDEGYIRCEFIRLRVRAYLGAKSSGSRCVLSPRMLRESTHFSLFGLPQARQNTRDQPTVTAQTANQAPAVRFFARLFAAAVALFFGTVSY